MRGDAYMINLLMRNPPIILQNIIILRPRRLHKLLHHRKDLSQLVIGDIRQFLAVGFWDNQGVTPGEGLNVKEGEDALGFVELEGGDVPLRLG